MAAGRQIQEKAEILENSCIQGDYYRLRLHLPKMVPLVQAGQFVHVQVPGLKHRVLRRPFSICDADPDSGVLTVIYKVVGEGTDVLSRQLPGTVMDVLGPEGKGYSPLPQDCPSVILGGGYGCAAIYLLAKNSVRKPVVLLGARSSGDILLDREFRDLGCEVEISTDDGSLGTPGRITVLLEAYLARHPDCRIAACGPTPMLKAVGLMASCHGLDAELSMDRNMCCGVGACFACVIQCKDETNPDGWRYARTCQEGPVFLASSIYWG